MTIRLIQMAIAAITLTATVVYAADANAQGQQLMQNVKAQAKKNKTNFIDSGQLSDHPDSLNDSKLIVEGGLYSQQKFDRVEKNKGKKPALKLISPMQRQPIIKKYAEDDDDKYTPYSLADIDHSKPPCGNSPRGRVHFDAELEQVIRVDWQVLEDADKGLCILKLADGPDDQEYDILWPSDRTGRMAGQMRGYFPCGRSKGMDYKEVKLPKNITCDQCILQMVWNTQSKVGKLYYCADMEILGGEISDCAGQCMNGGVCINGVCQCRKGFQGNFCQIKEYVPDSTNYTKYLKYFLFFIIMILAIVVLFVGAYLLFRQAKRVYEQIPERPQMVEDPDDLSAPANPNQYGKSKFGQNADITAL